MGLYFLCFFVLFYKDKNSRMSIRSILRSLLSFRRSQLITFSAEIVSLCLKTVNTTIQSLCCQLASLFFGVHPLCPTHISSCANVLCTSWSCTVMWLNPNTVPAVDSSQTLYLPFGVAAAAMMKTNTFVSIADIELHRFQHPIARHHTL